MKLQYLLHLTLAITASLSLTLHAQQQYQWSNFVGKPGGPGNVDGPALTKARFQSPQSIARDASGNLFVADTNNHTIRKITPAGMVTTFAGKAGTPGSTNGTGSSARFSYPYQIAFGPGGVLYVADYANNCIRKVTPSGVVSTLAGLAGSYDYADGTGAAARFRGPVGIAVDSAGNVYVADYGNQIIRKVTSSGVVTTLAGSPGVSGSTDGNGAAARFGGPEHLTITGGNLYVAEISNHTIRKVTLSGEVTTFAGLAGANAEVDGTGSAARFSYPYSIASDSSGNVFVGEKGYATLRKITPAGVVTTLAGTAGVWGFADGTGPAAKFDSIDGLCAAPDGAVLLVDHNHVVRRVTPAGVVTTIAGSVPTRGSADGTGTDASFSDPSGMAVNSAGELLVADSFNHAIRKVTSAGVVTTYAGTAGSSGSDDGPVASAKFNYPRDVAVDGSGNVWVADSQNRMVRLITPAGSVSTLAGMAGQSGNSDGTGSVARFDYLSGIALTGTGPAFVMDSNSSRVRRVTSAGEVTTVAGSTYGYADGVGLAARFTLPSAIAADADGTLYVADTYSHTIRKITPAFAVTTLAGTGNNMGSADGTGAAARFNQPNGIAVNGASTVFVADTQNHTIRRITSSGLVTTIGGTAGIADAADGMNGVARFSFPQRIAVGPDGTLYVTDKSNRIMKGVPLPDITVQQPVGVNLIDGKTTSFGPVQLTTTAVKTFTIRNDSDATLSGLAMTMNGANAADFTTTSLPAATLVPGASMSFDVTFHANTLGTRTAAVHITSNDADESPFDIVLTAVADMNPTVVTAPQAEVRYVGDSVTFHSTGTHVQFPVTYQWKKNGSNIAGATSQDLTLNSLTLSSAATYTVVMTAGGKSVSRSATLAVIQTTPVKKVVAKAGTTISLTATNTTGTGIWLWKRNGTTLPNSNSKTLKLSALTSAANTALYQAFLVRGDGAEVLAAGFDVQVFNAKPYLVLVQNIPDGAVGSPYSHQIVVTSGTTIQPTSYAASGLPPGVTINTQTGLISGTPTQGKSYSVTVSASNAYGTSNSITETITIVSLHPGVVGSFNGVVNGKGLFSAALGGRIDFTVASTGSITGSSILTGVKYSFTGKIDTTGAQPTSTITIPRPGAMPITINLVFAPGLNALDATSTLTSGLNSTAINAWRQVWRTTGALPLNPATTVAKRYNFALNPPATPGLPEGSGYGSFTLATNGTLTVTGKTPEGDSFTSSGFAGPLGQVLVYQSLYANQGALVGVLDIDPTDTGAITDTLNGSLFWTRTANSASRYSPSGFTKLALTAFGGRYTAPVAPALILGMALGDKALLNFTGGSISTASINPNVPAFDIIAGNKAMLPASLSAGNPGSVKFTTLNATTGQFSGSFTLSDNELRTGSTYAGKKFVRTVTFNGVLTQDAMGPVGAGCFLLPELPTDTTPSTKTLIHSGYVQMQKKP